MDRVLLPGTSPVHGSWYRGEHCNVHPRGEDLLKPDAMEKYVLHGWLPEKPWLTKGQLVTTFGSCFADHINNFLTEHGYRTTRKEYNPDSHVIRCGDGVVNTHALEQQFAWAWEGIEPQEETWHGWQGDPVEATEKSRLETRAIFDATDVFILTLGLSEVWYSKVTGEVFWRAIPKRLYDPKVHGFKVLSVEENLENIWSIWGIIQRYSPRNARVIFTLSPVPLVATFRPIGCVTANEVSKSCLRIALDQFLRDNCHVNQGLFYWPSYEMVKCWPRPESPYEEDNRHVRKAVVAEVMQSFVKHYCVQE